MKASVMGRLFYLVAAPLRCASVVKLVANHRRGAESTEVAQRRIQTAPSD
jgi:hypothetical protein